jgi:acetyl/propionyl-CoA carboxylase alpha subunit
VQSTSAQAERAFSDASVYLEKLVKRARHVEVQVFGRGKADPLHLHIRECSLQRRYQKVIEEALPGSIRPEAVTGMIDAALNLVRAVEYSGAGTIEYLYDDESGAFYFMEMNTRLQVEHPVTEMVTGQDIVAMQIRHALGQELGVSQADITPQGHAIELRVCAEAPEKNFMPAPGRITAMDLPSIEGLRIDTGFAVGDEITPFYDSLVMKIIGHGKTRAEAIATLRSALSQTRIEGLTTNLAFLDRLLAHPDFAADRLHTKFIETHISELV